MPTSNIWSDDWQLTKRDETDASRKTRLPRGDKIGATVYELDPGSTGSAYHFHHGAEELLVVLRGRPTLRTPTGERELEEGEVVHFGVGPEGAHQVSNRTQSPLRYLVASNRPSPEAVEYPDTREVSVMALTDSQFGERLWDVRTLERPADEPA